MKQISIVFLLAFILKGFEAGNKLSAQVPGRKDYPQGYFRNPLRIPISLSGNFGELRPNHFHMGMDIKTLARENQPVYAAADGYVARIKIEPAGFGRAIYINHPNGFTTLYAHLNDFVPSIESYLKEQQYQQEAWNVFLELPPGQIKVKKGDLIAYSGNTGGSQAPHLHFEIRRTIDDVNLNPMLFGFPLADNIKPRILRMALYDRNKSTYEQSPRLFPVRAQGSDLVSSPSLVRLPTDKVSFAITAYDTHTGSSNLNGIYEAWLYDNDELVTGFQMDNISYNQTRYLNAHIDYKTKASGGPYLQHLSELPGNLNSIYTRVKGDGVLDISDGKVHSIKIVAKDAYGNTTVLKSSVQYTGGAPSMAIPQGRMFYPMMVGVDEEPACEFYVGENCLYDSVHIKYTRTSSTNPVVYSDVHTIGATYIPLQDSILVRLKLSRPCEQLGHLVMQRFAGSKKDVSAVEWQNGWASAKFRDFGSFQLVLDEDAPEIHLVGFADGSDLSKVSRILITVKDNQESFKHFRATLDGKWLRFSNDKGRTFIYQFDEKCPRGEHTLEVSVEDEAGNKSVKTIRFRR